MSAEDVAKAFVGHFYPAFASNPDSLAGLYVSRHWLFLGTSHSCDDCNADSLSDDASCVLSHSF